MIEAPKINDPSLVYMYGISDFWTDMFGDSQLVESLLAGETLQLAEAYSYFLQRSAGISLTDIQQTYKTRIKLLLLKQEDLVGDDLTEFSVRTDIVNTKQLCNRPILPTQTLENNIDFELRNNVVKFNKPISELKFPVRYNTDGTWEYAVWMCDVEINERWIDKTFGRLVGFTEEDAIFNYKSFLEGVYYLYSNGPNISYIERGVNLAMGMPYARATETVLDLTQDAVSGNWIVFTPTQGYEIPYGFRPDIVVGDTITENEVLTTWVEVVDYSTSGAWWYQIFLPNEVLGPNEDSRDIGRCDPGSTGDYMMETFLKHHMFEVLITQPTGDITAFNTARDLVLRSKPEYTYPIFIWRVPVEDELIDINDELGFSYFNNFNDSEYAIAPPSIREFRRGTPTVFNPRTPTDVNDPSDPAHADWKDSGLFVRGTNWYNRCQGSQYAASLLGYGDWPDNAGWDPRFQSLDLGHTEYMGVLMRNRGDTISPTNRGTITRGWRGVNNENYDGVTWTFQADEVYNGVKEYTEVSERSITPLYLMNRVELLEKMRTVDPRFTINGRNRFIVTELNLPEVYSTWMVRNDSVSITQDSGVKYDFAYTQGGLYVPFSILTYQSFVPKVGEMYDSEGYPITNGTIVINRCTDDTWAVQWVRHDISYSPSIFPVEDADMISAIEEYRMSVIGQNESDNSIHINAGRTRIQTPRLVNSSDDVIVVVDGRYVPIGEYTLEEEYSQYEEPVQPSPEDPIYYDLPVIGRSFINLTTRPSSAGYMTVVDTEGFLTKEDMFEPSGNTYTLSETVAKKEDILVIVNGVFEFDYTVEGNLLTLLGIPTSEVYVRYVNTRNEATLPPGSASLILPESAEFKLFTEGRIIEEWAYKVSGLNVTLGFIPTSPVIVRFSDYVGPTINSLFTRSTVETNQARFLMDRSREGGEYDDFNGQTVFMDRSGRPKLSNGSEADSINVFRRLR